MTRWEQVKDRYRPGQYRHLRSNSRGWVSLNEEHVLGPARCVNASDLRFHLRIDHGISVEDAKTPQELGRLHLLAHALIAHPDLRELIGGGALLWEYK